MKDDIKRQAWLLSLFGVAPFALCVLAALCEVTILTWQAIDVFRSYSAIILSFLGGITWMYAMCNYAATPRHLSYAVAPALIAFFGYMLGDYLCLTLYAISFALYYAYERHIYDATFVWFIQLRAIITCIVIVLHGIMGYVL